MSVHLCARLIILQVLWDWCQVLRRIVSAWHWPLPHNLSLGKRRRLCFLLHIDCLTERACGCGRAAHSTTHLIHSLDNNGNKTVVACSSNMVKKDRSNASKRYTQQTWSGILVLWVVKVIFGKWVQIWLAWSSLSSVLPIYCEIKGKKAINIKQLASISKQYSLTLIKTKAELSIGRIRFYVFKQRVKTLPIKAIFYVI